MTANANINMHEAYTRRDNLIVSGLATSTWADAASTPSTATDMNSDQMTSSKDVVKSMLNLCNEHLHVPVVPQDISIAHRLLQRNKGQPAPIIVRFTSRKTRDEVFRAKKLLKGHQHKIYINEDLTKSTNGIVYTKKSDDSNSKPVNVFNLADLLKCKQM